ncbi:amidohydrolase family protein [Microbispora sp. KK1-11]|nr:amidohydrolase family protein [Microbispora sp. KK1-11]
MPKPVIDAHRLIGPVPFDDVPPDPLGDMDRLRIDRACVTHTLSLHSDPAAGNAALFAATAAPHATTDGPGTPADVPDGRLVPVPVVVPGVPGASVPDGPGEVRAWGVRMVRLCPERHRFDLTGPSALRWLEAIGLPVAIDLEETSPAQLITLAARLPGLRILLLNPGYRRLRVVAELMTEAANVRTEIGTVNTQGGVEWLAERFGSRRLVFGTGAPVSDDCGPRFLLDRLALPPEDVDRSATCSPSAPTPYAATSWPWRSPRGSPAGSACGRSTTRTTVRRSRAPACGASRSILTCTNAGSTTPCTIRSGSSACPCSPTARPARRGATPPSSPPWRPAIRTCRCSWGTPGSGRTGSAGRRGSWPTTPTCSSTRAARR